MKTRWVLFLTGLSGIVACYDLHEEYPYPIPKEEQIDPAARPNLSIPRELYYSGTMQESRLDKFRPVAKTLDWLNISTREGNRYLNGAIEVDKVYRQDADNLFGAKVRLKNRTRENIQFEYRYQFVGRRGEPILAHSRGAWRSMMIEPFLFTEVEDYAQLRSAVGFQMFLRRTGTTDEGYDDETLKELKWSGVQKPEAEPKK